MINRRTRLFSSLALCVSGLLLAGAPMMASAHTGNLFLWANNGTIASPNGGFATISKTNAALALVAPPGSSNLYVTGSEICGENGYGVANIGEGAAGVFTWNHSTGALTTPVTLTTTWAGGSWEEQQVTSATVEDVWELDTLADCSLIAIASISLETVGDPSSYELDVVIQINPTTGVAVTKVVLTGSIDEGDPYFDALATDPTTGVTYLFFEVNEDGSSSYAAPLNLTAGTVGTPVSLAATHAYFESSGFVTSADFDAAGKLWATFGVDNEEAYHLISLSGPSSALSTTVPADLGVVPFPSSVLGSSNPTTLTVDPAASTNSGTGGSGASLANTGADATPGFLGSGLLAAGILLFASTRLRRKNA